MTDPLAQHRADALAAQARRLSLPVPRESGQREGSSPCTQGAKPRRVVDGRAIAVRCVETGQVFPSMTLAADWLGCNKTRIYHSLNHGHRVRGHRFVFAGGRP
ncbi:MAG: hypothetical protein IT447_15505 [Phycisphaerales bacterium]|nr:hypothetical protein [Phycisphaerales bacterium]